MRAHLAPWLSLLLIASAASAGEIHKWVDKDGVVHYGDAPPPAEQQEATVVDVRVSQPPSKPYLPAPAPTPAAAATPAQPNAAASPAKKATSGHTLAEITKGESPEAKRARLIKECEDSRGVDCSSPQNLARMEKKEKPLTAEERAANRNPARQGFCVRNPTQPGC